MAAAVLPVSPVLLVVVVVVVALSTAGAARRHGKSCFWSDYDRRWSLPNCSREILGRRAGRRAGRQCVRDVHLYADCC